MRETVACRAPLLALAGAATVAMTAVAWQGYLTPDNMLAMLAVALMCR